MARRTLLLSTLLLACGDPPDTGAPPVTPPTLAGLHGSGGTALWSDGKDSSGAILERETTGAWEALGGGGAWFDAGAPAGALYRLVAPDGSWQSEPILADGLEVALDSDRKDGLFYDGDALGLRGTLFLPAVHDGLGLALVRTSNDGTEDLLRDAWPEDTTGAVLLDLTSLTADADAPGLVEMSLQVTFEAEPGISSIVGSAAVTQGWLGRRVWWGDLHAHTNLSYDGCEDPDNGCSDREGAAASTFFAEAQANSLDFAAMTDHAEYVTYYPTGSTTDPGTDIWSEQQRLVQEAGSMPSFVPILGYEWTYDNKTGDNTWDGGHKTVIFAEDAICGDYRIAAETRHDHFTKAVNRETYVGPNPFLASDVPSFIALLDEAAATCGEARVLTFFHHTAAGTPQPVDWAKPGYEPDPRHEMLTEVYSEHGCSECADASGDCDWRLPEDGFYYGVQGSFQTALSLGYRLGVLAGTDSHDDRPGSLSDGPSCTSNWFDEDGDGVDELSCLPYNGGLSGILASDLSRASLFDALEARRTLATSGPRIPVRVAAFAGEILALPGDVVQAGVIRVVAAMDLPDGVDALGMDLLDGSGAVRGEGIDGLDTVVEFGSGDAVYLRVRVAVDGVEERIWASPFFGE